ncbi:amidotransferase 1, exosortase A system-associated [Oxalobacteraceae bacterium]|nr:amidotransferase 1, exosortase A system-associated [Oxalobacteraceae bacterium]
MCAIIGIVDLQGRASIDAGLLERMSASQLHRGPDEHGTFVEPGVALGHRRLSIIDLSTGQQPLFNEDGSVVVVYNGEIYNYPALMRELRQFGHHFRTQCDTEVIVHAWEQWGEQCVNHFRGMFAFALWDRGRQQLFLARDRLGVKPLHYAFLADGSLIFGSELKALLAHSGFARALDPLAIEDYLAYGYIPEPRTVFRGASKLAPGHTLLLRRGAAPAQPRRFWDLPFTPLRAQSEAQLADELRARLLEAVRIRLVAEVPLGAFLSGGVDSSSVVALMAQCSDQPVNTCAIAFDDARFDESPHAQEVADRYATRHHVEQVGHDDFSLIGQLASLYDEPFADSSALPTYRVCELARRHVTVALSGDGGDENLAGYRRYRMHVNEERWRGLLPLALRQPLFGMLGRLYPKADWAPRPLRAKTTFEALARDTVAAYFHSVAIVPDALRARLFSPAFQRSLGGYRAVEVLRGHAVASPTGDPLSLVQYLDFKTYLPGDILTKVDRASMAHALEVRVPLLDHQLVEWISGLPPQLKLHQGRGKYLFKRAMENDLPAHLLHRGKMGFSVPMAAWLRGPLRQRLRDALLGPTLADSGIFNLPEIASMLEQHQSGRRDYSAPLWSLLMLESFLRHLHAKPVSERRAA